MKTGEMLSQFKSPISTNRSSREKRESRGISIKQISKYEEI